MTQRLGKYAAFLDSVAPFYPGAVPSRSRNSSENFADGRSSRGEPFVWDGGRARVLIVAVDGLWQKDQRGLPFGGENGKLLEGIITRGLRLSAAEVCVLGACSKKQNPQWSESLVQDLSALVAQTMERINPQAILALGAQAVQACRGTAGEEPGCWSMSGSHDLMPLYGLSDIRENQPLKKQFWEALKQVISRLKAVS